MDIVKIVKYFHSKANFTALSIQQKFFFLLFLFSLIPTLIPQQTSAAYLITEDYKPKLVFDTNTSDHWGFLVQLSQEATDTYYADQLKLDKAKQELLSQKVKEYLQEKNSPLAEYAFVLVTVRNWKKIVALSNAESSMCRKYPTQLANCWGVGGSKMWDMGDNLAQGIIGMNHFLNAYPKGKTKYSQMSFKQMNGLYKQPAADHWVYNNESIYNDLVAIEKSI